MAIEIQRADARSRRISIIVLIVSVMVALAFFYIYQRWVTHLAATLPTEQLVAQLRRWIGVAMTVCGLCLLLLAGYAAWLARRTLDERRWPPTSLRVVRDTPIRRDAAAARIAKALHIAAVVLVVLAVVVAWLSWRVFALGL
jgi:fatty acid desaturase